MRRSFAVLMLFGAVLVAAPPLVAEDASRGCGCPYCCGTLPNPSAYILNNRWGTTATNGSGLQQGDPTTLTWGFLADGINIPSGIGEPAGPSDLIAKMDAWYGAGPGGSDLTQRPWFNIWHASFDRWAQLSGLSFVYEPNDDGALFSSAVGVLNVRADLRIGGHSIDGQNGPNVLAYNDFPDNGDMVIDTDNSGFYSNPDNNSRGFRNVIMHEHGHGMGLAHIVSNNAAFLMEPSINTTFDGPQLDDIRGAHRGYGDFNEKSNSGAGNDVIGNATSLGVLSDGGQILIGEDARTTAVAANAIDFVSIDDDSDTDFYSFTTTARMLVDLLLTPLGPIYNQTAQGGNGDVPFNSAAVSDLVLAVFDSGGQIAFANNTGVGNAELISGLFLGTPGQYFVRITGDANNVQMYELQLTGTAIPEPATLGLLAAAALLSFGRRRRGSARV